MFPPIAVMMIKPIRPARARTAHPLVFFLMGCPHPGQDSAFGLTVFLQEGQVFIMIFLEISDYLSNLILRVIRDTGKTYKGN